jgi:hypothetical protein
MMVAQGDGAAEAGYSGRGVKTRILGFIIMVLGVLDSLLTLRGGVPAYEFLLLIVFGAVVFAIGTVRGAQKAGSAQASIEKLGR